MTKIIVACAGPQDKWNGALGTSSHLVPDRNGEPILHRTVRLVKHLAPQAEVVITTPPGAGVGYLYPGARTEPVHPNQPNEYWSTARHWDERRRTVVLLGDVWFTEEALRTVLEHRDGFWVYGNPRPSKLTGSPYGEIFAFAVTPDTQYGLLTAMRHVSTLRQLGTIFRNSGWEILGAMQGEVPEKPTASPRVDPRFFVTIDDLTGDLDYIGDWVRHPMFGERDE